MALRHGEVSYTGTGLRASVPGAGDAVDSSTDRFTAFALSDVPSTVANSDSSAFGIKALDIASEASDTNNFAQTSSNTRLPQIRLYGVWVHSITERQANEFIINSINQGRGGVVVTPNLDHIRRCRHDLSFAALVAEADLVLADGMPLVWASRLQATPLPQRVAGSDLITSLSEAAAKAGKSIFLLGGDPGTAEAAGRILTERFPALRIAGFHCPAMGFEDDPAAMATICEKLQASKADIVYVALGSPKQERLIDRLRGLLPGAWWLGVGVSFSFLAGDVQRAPIWMRRRGLEWVHRLVQEPRRLFRRYLVDGLPFGVRLLGSATLDGIATRMSRTPPSSEMPRPIGRTPGRSGGGSGLVHLPGKAFSESVRVRDVIASNADSAHLVKSGDTDAANLDRTLAALESHQTLQYDDGHGLQAMTNGTPLDASDTAASAPAGTPRGGLSGHGQSGSGDSTGRDGSAGGPNGGADSPASRRYGMWAPPAILSGNASAAPALRRLRGVILLAGSVRPNPLRNGIGRNLLDLPVDAGGSIFDHWLNQTRQVQEHLGLASLPVRVLLAHNAIPPKVADPALRPIYTVERDESEYRGTGGILANLADDYDEDDLILVGNAAQILLSPLAEVTSALGRCGGVVSLVSHHDGTPSGLMLVTCKALKLIPRQGFVDMKEQALPAIASSHEVRVLYTRRPTGLPVRTLADYIGALRQGRQGLDGKPSAVDPLAEDWRPSFAMAEPGAQVDPKARVHDSVILDGGIVESGAVVVRSLVCAGGVVRKDHKTVDQIIAPASARANSREKAA